MQDVRRSSSSVHLPWFSVSGLVRKHVFSERFSVGKVQTLVEIERV